MRGILGALLVLVACSTAAPEPSSAAPAGAPDGDPFDAGQPRAASLPSAPAPVRAAEPAPAPAAEPAPEPDRPAPDSLDAVVRDLEALTPDPTPEHTTNDIHYLVSNERRHDLFRPELDDRGGVMLGVGSDQNYVMAAWARTELLVVVDFDQKIVDLHALHGILMQAAPTADEFRRLWSERGAPDAREAIAAATADTARREELLALHEHAREWVDKRLRRLARRYRELGVHSYLDTPAQYRHVALLHARGRVVALRGDFTREGLLRQVAATLRDHGQELEILYLSNIEQYFTYKRPFKQNMLALPLAEPALVLRTLPGRPAGFNYILQSGEDFRAWMRAPRVWSVYKIRRFVKGEPLEADERFIAGPPPAEG